jgi:hypothetical protein
MKISPFCKITILDTIYVSDLAQFENLASKRHCFTSNLRTNSCRYRKLILRKLLQQ